MNREREQLREGQRVRVEGEVTCVNESPPWYGVAVRASGISYNLMCQPGEAALAAAPVEPRLSEEQVREAFSAWDSPRRPLGRMGRFEFIAKHLNDALLAQPAPPPTITVTQGATPGCTADALAAHGKWNEVELPAPARDRLDAPLGEPLSEYTVRYHLLHTNCETCDKIVAAAIAQPPASVSQAREGDPLLGARIFAQDYDIPEDEVVALVTAARRLAPHGALV
jgi:hypothetical protein